MTRKMASETASKASKLGLKICVRENKLKCMRAWNKKTQK